MEVGMLVAKNDQHAAGERMYVTAMYGSWTYDDPVTNERVDVGDFAQMGGPVPCLAVWDEYGHKIARHDGCVEENSLTDMSLEWEKRKAGEYYTLNMGWGYGRSTADNPAYLMVSNPTVDGICLSGIRFSAGLLDVLFWGDEAFKCGADLTNGFQSAFGPVNWMYSNTTVGAGYDNGVGETTTTANRTRCVWIDGDHTSATIAQSYTFELEGLKIDKARINKYSNNWAQFCQSTPRFAQWPYLSHMTDAIPFFVPRLKYNASVELPDSMKQVIDGYKDGQGEWEKNGQYRPNKALPFRGANERNKYPPGYDPNNPEPHDIVQNITFMTTVVARSDHNLDYGLEKYKKKLQRRNERRRSLHKRGHNYNIHQLTISEHADQPASAMCNCQHSRGYDFVSTVEGTFCDMEHKRLYKLCSEAHTHGCFDLEARELRPGLEARGADIEKYRLDRTYKAHMNWR